MTSRSSGIETRRQTRQGRFYDLPDRPPYPSVTTVLQALAKPALVNWAAKVERERVMDLASTLYADLATCPPMSRAAFYTTLQSRLGDEKAGQKLLAKAGEIGSEAHQMIEWRTRTLMGQAVGAPPAITDKAQWAVMAWEDWWRTHDVQPIHVEQVVFSDTHRYAGTVDLVARVDGLPMLIDYKTGKAVYAEAHLQNAAYQHALLEMGHEDCAGGLVVRLPKVETDPEFEVVPVEGREEMFQVFVHLLQVWRWQQNGGGK